MIKKSVKCSKRDATLCA